MLWPYFASFILLVAMPVLIVGEIQTDTSVVVFLLWILSVLNFVLYKFWLKKHVPLMAMYIVIVLAYPILGYNIGGGSVGDEIDGLLLGIIMGNGMWFLLLPSRKA